MFSFLNVLDRDGDKRVTENDFVLIVHQYGLGAVGEQVARTLFRQMDLNRNGILEMNEVMALINTIRGIASGKGINNGYGLGQVGYNNYPIQYGGGNYMNSTPSVGSYGYPPYNGGYF